MSKLDELIAELCPDGVEYKTLGELGSFYGGITGKSKKDFENGNAVFITYRNVYSNPALDIHPSDRVKIGKEEKQRSLEYGDIIFTGSSETPDECGFSSVVTEKPDELLYLNSFCFFFRFHDASIMLPDFAKHLFRSDNLRYQIGKTASGVTRFNVSKDKMAKVSIPVPPLEVQREIVRVLDNFTFLSAELSKTLDSELQARKNQYQEYSRYLFSRMESIRTTTLGDIVEIQMCKRIKKDQTSSTGDVPFYQNGTLGGIAKLYITNELFEEFSKKYKYPSKGEVMLSTVGTVGKAIQFDGSRSYYQDSNIVWLRRKSDEVTDEYLYWFCISMPWKLPERATLKHLHNYMIADTEIMIPSLKCQKDIVSKFQNLQRTSNEIIETLRREIEIRQKQYEYYRDKLLTFDAKVQT